jgi:MFS family permease
MSDFLIYSGYLILVLNLILFLFSFFRKEKANVFFILYLIFVFVMQLTMEVMAHLHHNNLFAVNIFFVGQMIILGLFYNSILKYRKQRLFLKSCLLIALLILILQYIFDYRQFLIFNLFCITLTSLLTVIFALMHFYNMLTHEKEYHYFNIGVVFYLFSSTVLYLVGNITSGLSDDLKYLSWNLNAVLILLYYLTILYEWRIRYNQFKQMDK